MLVQRFHPGIQLGQQPTLVHSGKSLFSRQGHWDGGSALHCIAMALALQGTLADPVNLPEQQSGNGRVLWDHAWPHYLHGLTVSEVVSFIAELDLGIRPLVRTGQVAVIVDFITRELSAGHPVIVGLRQRPNPSQHQGHAAGRHAALVVGIEGHQLGRRFEPRALLLLDPAGNKPGLAGFNVRLDPQGIDLQGISPQGSTRVRYQSSGNAQTVNRMRSINDASLRVHAVGAWTV